ncbi:MAG: ABC transporter permease [Deltaproteobacteria bacterium]|nr:ABC transporter permease [Deltaproteobacteria bacterium]
MLRRKVFREVLRQGGQAIAVALVMGLGVMMFVASYGGYLDLSASYDHSMDRMHLADWTLALDDVTAEEVARVARVDGVAAADARLVADLPVTLPRGRLAEDREGEVVLQGRIISLPDAGQPVLDQVVLVAGELPRTGQVLVEKRFARFHHLEAGSSVEVRVGEVKRAFTVSGLAVSAEYLWVARSRQDIFPQPTEFGVMWLRRSDLAGVAKTVGAAMMFRPPASGTPDAAAQALQRLVLTASHVDHGNELLVDVAAGRDPRAVLAGVRSLLGPDRVNEAVPRDELVGVELLRLDVDGFREMAGFFPFFFLAVGAFIVLALLGRMVDAQRALIGTFRALGLHTGAIHRHYLGFALVVCATGVVPGALLGMFASVGITRVYAQELGLPFVTSRLHPELLLGGLAMGMAVALVAGMVPARRASRLLPAEAMRAAAPAAGPMLRWMRAGGALPLWARMAVRNLLRRPGRSLSTALGVSSALVLLVVSGGLVESAVAGVDAQFSEGLRYDMRVDLFSAAPADELRRRVASLADAERAEVLLALPVRLATATATRDTVLQGLGDHAELLRAVDFKGAPVALAQDGLTLSTALAQKLGVKVGDVLDVRLLPDGQHQRVPLTGMSDLAFGSSVTMRLADAQRRFRMPGLANSAVAVARAGKRVELRQAMQGLDGVARVEDAGGLRDLVNQFMGLTWLMLGMMLLLSAILAAAILYNTASLSILERTRELATLRALGLDPRRVARAVTLENAVLALVGLVLGYPVAHGMFLQAMALWTSDMFALPPVISATTLGVCACAILLVLLAAQWPALRQLSRLNLADAVRARE